MKLKNYQQYSNKLLKFKLIQNKIYNKKQHSNNVKIEDIEYRLKKIFYIIYKYHIYNKKILFLGASLDVNSQLKSIFKSTKHIFIPINFWIKGAISNKQFHFINFNKIKKPLNKKLSEFLFQLKNQIDLIVVLNESETLDVINEGYETRIPVISLNSQLTENNSIKSIYKVPGNFQFKSKAMLDNLFYSLLISTLKKGNRHKKILNSRKISNSRINNR